uniref:Ubiquitin-conjugating enzyme E2 35 n=1 Tax=Rhizophora mucronata TaxID=61149 RepID=A0A2P2LU03_RHIMU
MPKLFIQAAQSRVVNHFFYPIKGLTCLHSLIGDLYGSTELDKHKVRCRQSYSYC